MPQYLELACSIDGSFDPTTTCQYCNDTSNIKDNFGRLQQNVAHEKLAIQNIIEQGALWKNQPVKTPLKESQVKCKILEHYSATDLGNLCGENSLQTHCHIMKQAVAKYPSVNLKC